MAFQMPARGHTVFAERKNEGSKLMLNPTHGLFYLQKCESCDYVIEGKLTKLIIEGCNNVKIKMNCMVLTGTVEVINSSNIKIDCTTLVPTMTADNVANCEIGVISTWGRKKGEGALYTSRCKDMFLVIEDKVLLSPFTRGDVDDYNQKIKLECTETEMDRFKSKFGIVQYVTRYVNSEITTELVVREGRGYATTQREKDIADKKEELLQQKLQEMLSNLVVQEPSKPSQKEVPQDVVDQQPEPREVLDEIKSFPKENLKPTQTNETHIPVVNDRENKPQPNNKPKYGHSNEDEIREYFDEPEEVERKVKELANMVRNSKHVVAYTGAGVSTSAKIPDYRGPQGVWTLKDKGLRPKFEITIEQALPTPTHMALVEMQRKKMLGFVVSTNVDGLHRRAGTKAEQMSELHGNCYKELCSKCGKEYLRTFDVTQHRRDHKTGRNCEKKGCSGYLMDSIINFGENLPEKELSKAVEHSKKSDLALVLGTSMRVQPACELPHKVVKNNGNMVIVNLQKTPYDKYASLIIRERTDKVMSLLMKELGLEIPQYDISHDSVKGSTKN